MDPNSRQAPRAPQRPPSIDGFIKIDHAPPEAAVKPAGPSAPAAAPAPAVVAAATAKAPPPPSSTAAPSATSRPFMPASFYTPPPPPNLPTITDTPPPPRPEKRRRHQGLRDSLSVAGVLASALLLAFVLINFVFQSYQVEGPSMRTTLEDNDHLIVWKVDKTIAQFSGHSYIPHRGDVIIFDEPPGGEGGSTGQRQLIKRVIGLPGDRVVFKDTSLMVYNQEQPDGFNPDTTLPYGDKIIFERPSSVDVTVGQDQVFVVGDNRDNSRDSRIFGPIDSQLIVGRLALRILPLNTFKTF